MALKNMYTIEIFWIFLTSLFFLIPLMYYFIINKIALKPWNLNTDLIYNPNITILIPTHNEEKMIKYKLLNIKKLDYPSDRIHVIITDDASSDDTLNVVNKFRNDNQDINITVLANKEKVGKTSVLNDALQLSTDPVIVMTDADSFLSQDIIKKALIYLSDPSISAVTARQKVLNPNDSFYTKLEDWYLNLMYKTVRPGQSKIYSSFITHGSFVIYKKSYLDKFNYKSDDSGTSLDIIQKGGKVINIPDLISYDVVPVTFRNRFVIKSRRAWRNIEIYRQILSLYRNKKINMPLTLLASELYLYILNPIIFVILIPLTISLIIKYLPISLYMTMGASLFLIIKDIRMLVLETMMVDSVIFLTELGMLVGKKYTSSWKTLRDISIEKLEHYLKINNLI